MHDKHRRKSLSIFKPSLSSLAPIRDNASPPPDGGRAGVLKKKLRPTSLASPAAPSASSPLPLRRADSDASQQSASSVTLKGRPNSRTSRPSSIFGSIKSIHSLQSVPDDDSSVGNSTIRTSWGTFNGDAAVTGGPGGLMIDTERMVLLNHGEVNIGGGMFKKKSQYLVLTNTHLLRFRSQAKASEIFPGLSPPSSSSGSEAATHLRKPSNGSVTEISSDELMNIPVRQIVALLRSDEGKADVNSSSIIEIAHLDENSNSAATMTVQLQDGQDAEQWLRSLKSAVAQARASGALPYSRKAVEYVARTLENDGDYDPAHFHMYTVVQREKKSGSRASSSDDLGKLLSSISYLVIGYYKMHLVPLLRPNKSSSNTSLSDLTGSSYGLAALTTISCTGSDNTLQLGFRLPLQAPSYLYFASSCCNEIALGLRNALEFLRPLYLEHPFSWSSDLHHSKPSSPTPPELDDHLGFDRTLTAYCIAYKVDPSNIRYLVNYFGEDTPEFQLLEPASAASRPNYSALELLAIFRAVRYNDSFTSVSFHGIKLDALHGLVDRFGSEHLCWKTKTGQALDRPNANRLTLLVQEVQNIAVQNERLRRVDFSDSLSSKRAEMRYSERGSTEFVEALMPLCSQRLTNIDWIKLNGLALSELDISSLYSATLKRSCEFRALELGDGALSFEGMRVVAEAMQHQARTIECINISGCTAKLDDHFMSALSCFKGLRRLDLSRCQPAVSSSAFIPTDVLKSWRLESLKLSGTPLGQSSVEDLSAYLEDNQSSNMRELLLDSCQVNGGDIAALLCSLSKVADEPRKIMIDVSKNRIAQDQHVKIVSQIRGSGTPEQLVMRSLEYTREDDFRALLEAVTENKSLKYLDISSVALPVDASEETCGALHKLFEENDTLEELNISGEMAALEAATIGRGLPDALRGLARNKSLRVLHCQRQALGLPGASALASVLEENVTLQELHCDSNDISLQAFTALVNALESNKTLLYMPSMDSDRKHMTEKVNREVSAILASGQGPAGASSGTSSKSSSLRRSVTGLASYRPQNALRSSSLRSLSGKTRDRSPASGGGGANGSSPSLSAAALAAAGYTEQDLAAAVTKFDDTWEAEIGRMQTYLHRNVCLTQGFGPDGSVLEEAEPEVVAMRIPITAAEAGFVLPTVAELGESRPPTAGSLAAAIAKASLDRTPTAEFDRQLGAPKLSIGTSIMDKGFSIDGMDESAVIDTPVQSEFEQVFGGDEGDAMLVMGAK